MDVPVASWLLLVLASCGAFLALTAAVPGRHLGWGNVFWFLAGFLTAELAVFHIVLGAVVVAALAAAGALRAWPGQAGLVLVVLSCIALAVVQWRARPTAALLEAALREGLGSDYRSRLPPARLAAVDVPVGPELRRPFRFDAGDVDVIRDVRYDAVHARHRLDLYRPR